MRDGTTPTTPSADAARRRGEPFPSTLDGIARALTLAAVPDKATIKSTSSTNARRTVARLLLDFVSVLRVTPKVSG